MKKTLLALLLFTFLSPILIGCRSNSDTSLEYQGISMVEISQSAGFNSVNPDFFEVNQDEETLLIFADLLKQASRQQGIVDMIEPEYDLNIHFNNGNIQGFHLWVGDSGEISSLMKVDDTHTVYTLSAKITEKLIDLLQ